MKTYRVTITAQSDVSTNEWVEAESEEEAGKKALKKASEGNVEWKYQGVIDETIEIVCAIEGS